MRRKSFVDVYPYLPYFGMKNTLVPCHTQETMPSMSRAILHRGSRIWSSTFAQSLRSSWSSGNAPPADVSMLVHPWSSSGLSTASGFFELKGSYPTLPASVPFSLRCKKGLIYLPWPSSLQFCICIWYSRRQPISCYSVGIFWLSWGAPYSLQFHYPPADLVSCSGPLERTDFS